MTNMTSTITYMVILLFSLAMAIVVTAATTTTTAYAETAILTGIPKEISDALVSQTINRIQNYANNTSYINAPHDYTPENGYTFRDNQIFKPDGSALFQ